ncbi:TOG array regulator of axonemal microtubules protein 1 [Phytophthora citrophthora]|uniref:TOG array regulator of axonemal microtubules protein 1 n=1 Tax=Phytophthora citrophthora TaxID=4793 RepID=A0AAD9GV67_9STRA|nr:TOG array regulator of axonemal microtubules protein 1 [Phytophthora citrophthora]
METSVDTLVYQLEDDDTNVRWNTLQKLRRIAAVETSHFPVRNTRRFLQCVRRRIVNETDPHVAIEALRLLGDVMVSLGDNVDQLLSSILPHLIPILPRKPKNNDQEEDSDGESDALYEEVFQIFRKYVNVTSDLQAAADVLVNIGLGSGQGSVREASLIVLVRLLDERFLNRSRGNRRESIGRGDKALIMALVQAIIPALEDADEKVVVAAEEAIAKLESYWGSRFSSDVMKFLSGEDKRTLMEHQEPISDFLQACNTSSSPLASRPDSAASSSSDTREDLSNDAASTSSRSSPSKVHPLQMNEELRFGFLKGSIVTTLTTHTSNSNADWKKRAAAVEKLYAACKEVDASDLRGFTMEEQATRMNELETLFDILVRLTQDVDVHLVKRALQITQIIFRKLSPPRIDKTLIHTDGKDSDGRKKDSAFYMKKMLAPMVETAANFAEDDDEMESFVYTLLGQVFESGCVSVNLIEQVLATTSLRHRRSQVREEAVKVWIVLLLIAERECLLLENYAPNENVVQLLGRLLGDSNRGVRDVALEVSAVLTMVCDCNIYALLEAFIDDEYVSERVDWAALRMRLRRKQVLELRSNNTLRSKVSGTANCVRACRTGLLASSVEQSLDGVSVMKMMVAKDVQKPLEHGHHETITTATGKVITGDSLSDRSYFSHEQTGVDDARASSSEEGPATVDINDKLAALRKKVGQLRPPRTKRIRVPSSQEGSPSVKPERRQDTTTDATVQVMPRSKSSPEQSAFNPVDDQILNEDLQSPREKRNKGRRTVVLPVTKAYSSPPQQPAQLSPQHLQSLQSDAQNYEDHPKSTFTERQKALEPSGSRESPAERPIRPGDPDQIYLNFSDQEHSQDFDNNDSQSTKKTHGKRVMSLATRKRLEAKAKQDTKSSDHSCKVPSPVQNEISKPWKNPVKIKGIGTVDEAPRSSGKQEPRYLEPHEITPLVNPKQDLSKVLSQLRSEDWEGNFEALSTVRRLALHHANLLDAGKVHAILAEIMKQIPNLRSTVSKNALLALESMCAAFSRDMDSEVENIVPVLLKRCGDSNTFVCESAAASLRAVVLQCSISRVVLALASHGNSKAVPIRREVARVLHALIVDKADNIQTSKDLPSVLQLVGRSLEDSNNEVRDIAKQSILYLHFQRRMVSERIKKFLSPSAHAKIDSLLSGKVGYSSPLSMSSTTSDTVFEVTSAPKKRDALPSRTKKLTKQLSGRTSPPTMNNGARSKVNNDELLRLETKLGSNNWKDRFDALNETTEFICGCAPALVESGQMLNLFDQLIKRLDDGNAKVNVLALECMDTIVPSLGSGMEQVLPNFLPAITKNLANSRTSTLAQSIVQHLCAYVDNRSLCQQFAIQARSANTRVLPFLLDTLAELTARSLDDKSTYVLTRHVLPLALNLLKEAKSDVKEGNAKLLRQLRKTLGPTAMSSAASKLNSAQQGKLAAALR